MDATSHPLVSLVSPLLMRSLTAEIYTNRQLAKHREKMSFFVFAAKCACNESIICKFISSVSMRQHVEPDVVMTFLSLSHVVVLYLNECTYHLFLLIGASF